MLNIGERPILWHIMKIYAHHGMTRFVLALGYKGYAIREYFLNYRAHVLDARFTLGRPEKAVFDGILEEEDWDITLAETGPETMTGGRVARLQPQLSGPEFCLTYGDGVGNVDLAKLLAFHRSHGKIGTVTGVLPPGRFGELVVKPAVSAGSFATVRVARGDLAAARAHRDAHRDRDLLVQPYLRSVSDRGESNLVHFGGRFSHAIHKGARWAGDDEQSRGLVEPTAAELALAERALGAAAARGHGPLAYARVDMAAGADGAPLVMELEITEPSLFLDRAPDRAPLFVDAVERALDG